ncbi:general secretion pathway protein GspL [Sphingomonas sp. Leaf412]|uniref:type II secretion system protein GspL n=1 Tax=Sphingomonas sp. Leaf412 TaxID=1736370 RepID=UPI0006FF8103|nr:type II secretion system protein GspL [Sphingomonas sp. Leaf412]KQT32733.1 general secretion pathway protein GspL [Sphingomonas sp. Leaf412]
MTAATLLFLPPDDATPWRWWRVDGDAVVADGEGLPVAGEADVIAVAPADAVTLHWADLPARSPAQALAAARIVVGDATAVPAHELHVAIGPDRGESRAIAVVAADRMTGWLARLAADGIDPAAILPAPFLLPVPEDGYVRADLAGQPVVRGRTSGWADEARLTDLVTAGQVPATLARDDVRRAAAATLADLPLNLRQGPFARRSRRAIDWALVRRLAVLTGLILAVTLAIDVVRIARYSLGADTIEARADVVARQGLPRGAADGGDAARMLDDRLARLRGPGAGFSATAAAVYQVVQASPGSEVTALLFEPNGSMRVSLSAASEAEANATKARLESAGFTVVSSVFTAANGRLTGDLTVTP